MLTTRSFTYTLILTHTPARVLLHSRSTVGDYLVCPSCAFENFKNTRNCTICKTRLITPAPGAAVTAAAPKLQVPASSMV